MIEFERFKLKNGLTVLIHEDDSTPLVAVNLLYDVGARDESSERTGFAHLFEHLMFGGSENVPDYDKVVQQFGGSNNAFTTNDITNYYLTLPSSNLEAALWVESDRMNQLDFSERSLDVQRGVVVEEFKQRYLNQPYGDAMLLLRPLAYKEHPYLWPTIGKEIRHIEDAKLDDVKQFFYTHYGPQNCILSIVGNVKIAEVRSLVEKWFNDIPDRSGYVRNLPVEPQQNEFRVLEVERDVPADSLYMSFHMPGRRDVDYHTVDLLSDVLGRGESSRLTVELVKEEHIFESISAYVTGSLDSGQLMISGRLLPGVQMEEAEELVWNQLDKLKVELVPEKEFQKLKNKIESTTVFEEIGILNKAMNLCMFELWSKAEDINSEFDKYNNVDSNAMREQANKVFQRTNCSTLRYFAKK